MCYFGHADKSRVAEFHVTQRPHWQDPAAPMTHSAQILHVVLRVPIWRSREVDLDAIVESLSGLRHLESIILESIVEGPIGPEAAEWPVELRTKLRATTWSDAWTRARHLQAATAFGDDWPASSFWILETFGVLRESMYVYA